MSRAVLSFVPDGGPDQLGRLRLVVETPSFKGDGEAWAWPGLIEDFATALSQYPISGDNPPELRCGFGRLKVEEVVISLSVKAADALGKLDATINISDHFDRESRLRTHFVTHYPDVERFQKQLFALLAGDRDEAVLDGS